MLYQVVTDTSGNMRTRRKQVRKVKAKALRKQEEQLCLPLTFGTRVCGEKVARDLRALRQCQSLEKTRSAQQ